MQGKTFVFKGKYGEKLNTDSHVTYVTEEDLYHSSKGYGFVTEDNIAVEESLQIPELNSGFRKKDDANDTNYIDSDEFGCGVTFGSRVPLCFKIDVVRLGNYEVSVTFAGEGEILIFTGARRLVYKVQLSGWDSKCFSFTTNVCDMIPGGINCLYEHRSLDIVLVGDAVRLQQITYKSMNCPTVYLAGDSSVMDKTAYYPYSPSESYGGWGQMMPCFFKKGVSVSNHSQAGLNIESFRLEGYFAIIKAHLRLGDYLMIHFSKEEDDNGAPCTLDDYRLGMIEYLEETRAMGAYPIIVTPFCRNTWQAGIERYQDKQNSYAQICREIGRTYSVPVIDLHKYSKEFITCGGEKESQAYFMIEDNYNLNDYGAYKMAQLVHDAYADLMRHVRADAYAKLAGYLIEESVEWIPDSFEENTRALLSVSKA